MVFLSFKNNRTVEVDIQSIFSPTKSLFVYLNCSKSKPFDCWHWNRKKRRGYVVDWELTGCTIAEEKEEVDVLLMILDDELLLPPTVLDFPIILLSSNNNNNFRRRLLRGLSFLFVVDVFMLALCLFAKERKIEFTI